METSERVGIFLLRVGVAFAFLYPPIDAFFSPASWIGFFPHFARGYAPDATLLFAWDALEIVIALWILSGWRIFIPSALATVLLALIVLFNLPLMEVVFRDVSIALMSATLAWFAYTKR